MFNKWRDSMTICVVAGLLLSVMCSCAPSEEAAAPEGAEPTYQWRFSDINPSDNPTCDSDRRVIQEIYEKSNGRIVIDHYPGGALGDTLAMCGELRRGTLEMRNGYLPADYDPRLNITSTPLIVADYDQAQEAYGSPDGWMYKILDDLASDGGMKLLSSYPTGLGGVVFNSDLPPSPMDPDIPKKMKMRIWPCKAAELWASRMGFIPTTINWAELFTALETGVVDCAVGGTPLLCYTHLRDVSEYFVYYADHFNCWFFMINYELWESLSPEDQKIIRDAAVHESLGQFERSEAIDYEYMQKLRDYGVTVVIPTDDEFAHMREVMRRDVWPELAEIVGTGIMDEVVAHAA